MPSDVWFFVDDGDFWTLVERADCRVKKVGDFLFPKENIKRASYSNKNFKQNKIKQIIIKIRKFNIPKENPEAMIPKQKQVPHRQHGCRRAAQGTLAHERGSK